jgi:mannose-6-phosphate isomerase
MASQRVDKHLYPLKGVIQHYDWGGHSFIPSVTAQDANGKPMAEYWLGAHPSAPSIVMGEEQLALDKLIETNKGKYLGSKVAEKFSGLPFLLKMLDVRKMLSIQVHPSRQTASHEYQKENAAGIALKSVNRNYKDENHKPELMIAMSDFWLLHGFKPEKSLSSILQNVTELNQFKSVFNKEDYEALYRKVMLLSQENVNEILQPLLNRIVPLYNDGRLSKDSEDFWAARAALTFNKGSDIDRGIFSIYFFNLVQLKKGEAIFQDAGVPHAYLEGTNIEIMANSDNVLRGGLTPKHVDVNALLTNVKCQPTIPDIIHGSERNGEKVFITPVEDFEVSVIQLNANEELTLKISATSIFLLVQGKCEVKADDSTILLEIGSPAGIVFPDTSLNMKASEDALVFRATVPIHKG